MSAWTEHRLEDCLSALIDYRGRSPPKSPTGTPVISAKVVKSGRILRTIEQRIEPSYYSTWMTRGLPAVGDIILTTEGPLGEVAQLDVETSRFAVAQRVVVLRGKPGVLDNTFLKFLLMSSAQQATLRALATGTTVEGISQKSLRSMSIKCPAFAEQRAIGRLLGALDHKIELNRRMNETLEAMAQAIFRDWFVDFGPVRRKLAGERDPAAIMGGLTSDPTHAAELAELFPNALAPDDLPEGWTQGRIADLIEFNPPEPLRKGTVAPYSDMSSLPTQGSVADPPVLREFGAGMRFRNGDALLARITPCLENGKSAFVDFLGDGEVGWGSTEFIVMRSRALAPPPLAYLLARDASFREQAIRSMTGTSGRQRAQADALQSWPVAMASPQVLEAFGNFVMPFFRRITVAGAENRTLAETRDYLLPHLMSGKVRVPDAAAEIAA